MSDIINKAFITSSLLLAFLFGIYGVLSYNASAAALVQARVSDQLQLLALCGFGAVCVFFLFSFVFFSYATGQAPSTDAPSHLLISTICRTAPSPLT